MRLKYLLIVVISLGLVTSCGSKKKTAQKSTPPKKEVQVQVKKEPIPKAKPKTKKAAPNPIRISTLNYIEQYKDIAMAEMRSHKIPASITLAQGILESSSGNSELTRKSNNHFGIKCHKGWTGKRTFHDDDEKGECFRVYSDPNTSYKDHSLFLTGRDRYAKLFRLKKGDYVGWSKGLSAAGYATDRRYPAKLIALIEKYELYQYDKEVMGKRYVALNRSKPNSHIVVKGDTLYSISKKYGLTVESLKSLNELGSNTINIGQFLYLAKP
jgi:flagellum-specific peptidoglycan hydrolase FlgJ